MTSNSIRPLGTLNRTLTAPVATFQLTSIVNKRFQGVNMALKLGDEINLRKPFSSLRLLEEQNSLNFEFKRLHTKTFDLFITTRNPCTNLLVVTCPRAFYFDRLFDLRSFVQISVYSVPNLVLQR